VVLKLTDPDALSPARKIVEGELREIDRACSRFRADSELERVNAHAGAPVPVGALLLEAIEVGLRAARLTDGNVDPALGEALSIAGYDRDFELLEDRPEQPRVLARRTAGWRTITVDHEHSTVRIARGVRLDLGATAKALAADRAARAANHATGAGVLLSLGGDIALAGCAPAGGWRVFVTDDHRSDMDAEGQMISITSGGLASSSTTTRRWTRGDRIMHHIIDPATNAPVDSTWRTVSVAAATCVDANIASTAALVRGAACIPWLTECRLPARLVATNGRVLSVSGWPSESRSQPEHSTS